MPSKRAPLALLAAAMLAAGVALVWVALPHRSLATVPRLARNLTAPSGMAADAAGTRSSSGPDSEAPRPGAPARASTERRPDDVGNGHDVAFTAADDAHRSSLALSPVRKIVKGGGGRSLAFKITLEDGTVGYYKPEQTFSGTNWYAEVASYYLDRELGLGRVPPTIGRRLPWPPLLRAAGDDARDSEIIVQQDGTVRGAFVWWIPEDIPPIDPGPYWERWIRFGGGMDVSPLVAAYEWRDALKRLKAGEPATTAEDGEPRAPDTPDRPAELSDMILFDYLTHNLDRWGSHYTNVRTRGPHGPLIYLDNAAGFFPGAHRIGLMDARLSVVQKFRRRTVDAIRAFDMKRFRRRLATDPLAPLLDDHYLEGIEVRRRYLLEHVAEMERRFGDAAFPW